MEALMSILYSVPFTIPYKNVKKGKKELCKYHVYGSTATRESSDTFKFNLLDTISPEFGLFEIGTCCLDFTPDIFVRQIAAIPRRSHRMQRKLTEERKRGRVSRC